MKILCLVLFITGAFAYAGQDCRGGLQGQVIAFPKREPKVDHDKDRIKRLMTLLNALDETAATDPAIALEWGKSQVLATLQMLQLSQDQMEAYFELYENEHTELVEHYIHTMQNLYASPILKRLQDMYSHYEIVQARAQLNRVMGVVYRRDEVDLITLAKELDKLLFRISEFRKAFEVHRDTTGEGFILEFSGRLFTNAALREIMASTSDESTEVRASLTRLRVISANLRLRLDRAVRQRL